MTEHRRSGSRRVAASALMLLAACGSSDDAGVGATAATDVVEVGDTTGVDTTVGGSSVTDPMSPATDPAGGGGWTVLVYSIADTDLEPFMMNDLVELSTVGSSAGLNLTALVDRAAAYSSEPLLNLPDWAGGKLLQVEQGSMTETEDLGDIDTGDPELLASFIARGIADHPAEHYALILSDHGAAWPGIGGDESAGHNALSVAELRDGVRAGLAAAGVDRLDLLGFDACLMATYEVASAMAPLAERLLASQELEPGHGWDYSALSILADDPTTTVDTLGSAIIKGFEGEAEAAGTQDSITLSMIDLTKMAEVDAALTDFTGQLIDAAAQIAPVVGRNRATSLGFGSSPDPAEDTHMTDLALLVSEIGTDALYVSDAADSLVRAINDAVVDSVAGSAMRGATGLSIYFPPTAELYAAEYGELPIGSGWADFLAAYYGAGDAIPTDSLPRFLDPDKVGETSFDEAGLTISGAFDPAGAGNLAEATISYGTIDEEGTITFFGEEPGSWADDGGGIASGLYDLTTLQISDGEDSAVAYLTLTADDEAGTLTYDVPMAYYSPDDVGGETYQDVLLSLTVDAETGDILDETYYVYDDELGTYGELTADPAGIIVPEVLRVAADGTVEWVPTTDVGLFADLPSLQYELVALAAGTELYIDLTISDFGGNTDTVFATVQVP